jgi:hypothetical protein
MSAEMGFLKNGPLSKQNGFYTQWVYGFDKNTKNNAHK